MADYPARATFHASQNAVCGQLARKGQFYYSATIGINRLDAGSQAGLARPPITRGAPAVKLTSPEICRWLSAVLTILEPLFSL